MLDHLPLVQRVAVGAVHAEEIHPRVDQLPDALPHLIRAGGHRGPHHQAVVAVLDAVRKGLALLDVGAGDQRIQLPGIGHDQQHAGVALQQQVVGLGQARRVVGRQLPQVGDLVAQPLQGHHALPHPLPGVLHAGVVVLGQQAHQPAALHDQTRHQ